MRRTPAALLALTLAATGGLAACTAAQRRTASTAAADALISDQQEAQLGAQVKQELEQKQKIKYVQDAEVVRYVNEVSTKVLRPANKARPGIPWKIHVIDDPKQVNAFATPGGYLYVYSGLILAADNEAELAGVMAHEAGHVVGRHSARQMVNAYGLEAVLGMALGKNAGGLGQVAAGLAGNGAMLANSRGMETEADEYGAQFTSAANYDPRGLVSFFQKLQAQEGKTPGVLKWLSTHPTSADRVAYLNQYLARNNLRGSELGADRLQAIKRRLGGK